MLCCLDADDEDDSTREIVFDWINSTEIQYYQTAGLQHNKNQCWAFTLLNRFCSNIDHSKPNRNLIVIDLCSAQTPKVKHKSRSLIAITDQVFTARFYTSLFVYCISRPATMDVGNIVFIQSKINSIHCINQRRRFFTIIILFFFCFAIPFLPIHTRAHIHLIVTD